MLRELTKDDWLSILNIPANRIPRVVVLRGTRNFRMYYELYREHFTDVLDVGSPNGVFDELFVGELDGVQTAYASVYGAPMASEVTHVFGVLGTELVIQTGNCGALADDIDTGDIFVPVDAYCGEGASQYYKTDGKIVSASPDPELAAVLDSCPGDIHYGSIYTTSALFAEGEHEIADWHARGFAAVDMETAATFAVAEHFGMDRLSVLFAFDNPRRREHILLQDEEKTARRQRSNQRVMELVFDIVKRFESSQ
ncbi:MAG TPA: hypothetical protein DCP37_06965 [Dehalococcoidia bacterium]|jgi:uridine phosphorylase|nr:hypothetical protein [SAR202 cluster bacterium]MDP6799591.1 hypothetical protein [SAR202 cluster bacterium]HAL47480.1 hypothetical protein [Dehalococcoidia bacterium]